MGTCFTCLWSPRRQPGAQEARPRRSRRAPASNGHASTGLGSSLASPHPQAIAARRTPRASIETIASCYSIFSDDSSAYHSCREENSLSDGTALTPPDSPHGSPTTSQKLNALFSGVWGSTGPRLRRHSAELPAAKQDVKSSPCKSPHPHAEAATVQQPSGCKASEPDSAFGLNPEKDLAGLAATAGSQHNDSFGRCSLPSVLGVVEATIHADRGAGAGNKVAVGLRTSPFANTVSKSEKPHAGCSIARRDMSMAFTDVSAAYEDGDGEHYNIRSLKYMKTKVKVNSAASIYRLAAADVFASDLKQTHIAQHLQLPAALPQAHPDADLPPLLVVNIQLPSYSPSLFGSTVDGPGWSIVYYFTLPENFDPDEFPNQKALSLFKRFVCNGKEADGSHTRDRFKLIPRVVNVEEWAEKGPLSMTEHKLLATYNEKPILSRPQHTFTHGPNYLEVDLDIHSYAYLARTAFMSFIPRLSTVVFEVAFVVQGNSTEELPEQVLGCGRIFRTDFSQAMRLEPKLQQGHGANN